MLVSWHFEPSQPQRITARLKTMFSLSPIHSARRPSNHKLSKNHKISPEQNLHKTKTYIKKTYKCTQYCNTTCISEAKPILTLHSRVPTTISQSSNSWNATVSHVSVTFAQSINIVFARTCSYRHVLLWLFYRFKPYVQLSQRKEGNGRTSRQKLLPFIFYHNRRRAPQGKQCRDNRGRYQHIKRSFQDDIPDAISL